MFYLFKILANAYQIKVPAEDTSKEATTDLPLNVMVKD